MMEYYLKEQMRLHPSMQAQDIVKLCYQAAFGAEHLLGDMQRVKEYFDSEFLSVPEKDGMLAEAIADDVCRVNLAVWKKLRLPSEWLFNLFAISAGLRREGGEECFWEYMAQAEKLLLPSDKWRDFVAEYKKGGSRPVHHSETYRESERPAYRVVSGRHARLLPILQCMKATIQVIAIDGRAASGKTTMVNDLAEITGAGIVHVDDFFLPKELRTAERLCAPGGNFHHERLLEEALPFLRGGKAFSYRKFDCEQMDFNGAREVAESPLRIVEGAYSCHPVLKEYMDLRVFSDIAPQEQQARIEKRNGIKIAGEYASKWIPMEEAYLREYQIKDSAHVVV